MPSMSLKGSTRLDDVRRVTWAGVACARMIPATDGSALASRDGGGPLQLVELSAGSGPVADREGQRVPR